MYPKRIRELREDRDLKQAAVAAMLNTSQQQYSRYETGTEMPYKNLISLADFYHVSVDYILERTNNMENESNKENKRL